MISFKPIIWKLNEDSWEENVAEPMDILNPDNDFLGIDPGDIDGDGTNERAIALSYDDNKLCIFKYNRDTYTLITSISRDGPEKGLLVGDLEQCYFSSSLEID